MTDDIQKVREAYNAALEECSRFSAPSGTDFYAALAKRLQPRPVPEKKTWSVSEETANLHENASANANIPTEYVFWHRRSDRRVIAALNAIAPDIIRERPDLVAAEWERRYRAFRAKNDCIHPDIGVKIWRRDLFPELDP